MSRSPPEEIYLQIRGQFKAAEKCADKVKELITDYYPSFSKLNRTTLLLIMKMIRKDFKKEDWPEVKYMFKSIFVYILADHKPHLFMKNVAELLDVYPEFSDTDGVEKDLLLQFRNYFIVACEIIEPKNHKGELIALVGRMCGAIYVTGGGQTTATDRRVLLYERETGIAPRKQPERKRRADDPAIVQVLHSRHNQAFESTQTRPMSSVEMDPMFNKRPHYEASDTQTMVLSAASFWSYHCALMESGEDIPYITVPADQAYSSFAYPSHDLPYAMNHPLAMSNNPAMHPSMRFMHDSLLRPQMPMAMQMQLPPGRPLATPLPLALSSVANGATSGSSAGPEPGLGPGVKRNGAGGGARSEAKAGPSAGNTSRPGPSQVANSSADPHKIQALQQVTSLPSPVLGPPYHPGFCGPPPPPMQQYSYYGGPPSGSYPYPHAYPPYPPSQSMPLSGPEERFVPHVHPLSRYAPQLQHQPQHQGFYGSQIGSTAPHVYSGPASGGYTGPMAHSSQGSTQARPPLLPLTYSQLTSPLNSQFNPKSNSHTNTQVNTNS